jgi:AbrB family looped-hinge helix DNA binding protein
MALRHTFVVIALRRSDLTRVCSLMAFGLCHDISHMAKSNPVATRVVAGGRIVIPAAYRKALGIQPGDDVVLQLEDQEIRLYSRKQALRRLQDRVAKVVPQNVSLADELLRERERI